jgi:hypothetical protein
VSKVARKRSIDEVSDEEEDGEEDEDVAAGLSSNEDFQYYLQASCPRPIISLPGLISIVWLRRKYGSSNT